MSFKSAQQAYAQLYSPPLKMEDFTQEKTYQHTRPPVEGAMTLIPEGYTSQEFYDLEQERVFSNSWVAVGCLDQIKHPNDVLVVRLAGQSILVTRNKAGDLRAFYNVCRHRGTKMLEEGCTQLKSSRIVCPYHSWGYDFDGNCIGTPLFEESSLSPTHQKAFDMSGVEKFDRNNYGLFPVKVESWGFLIFLNLNENAPPLTEQLGDLTERCNNYRLEEWQIVREKKFAFRANYKLVGENFMEYYHLPWVHPELIKVSRMEDHHRWQGRGMYTGMTTWPISPNTQEGGWHGLPAMQGLQKSQAESARFIWLFPNVAINIMPNHAFIMLTQPQRPDHTLEQTWILCPPESLQGASTEAELDKLMAFWTLINEQDIEIVEKVQAGLSMRPYLGGRMCYGFEEPLHRFQNMIIDKMVGLERIPPGDEGEENQPWF